MSSLRYIDTIRTNIERSKFNPNYNRIYAGVIK